MKLSLTPLVGALAAGFIVVGAASDQPPNKPNYRPPHLPPPHNPSGPPSRAPNYPPAAPYRPNSLGADWRQQQDEARQGVRQRRMMPLETVIQQIRRLTPGRQLDAGLEYEGQRAVYRVRWMTRDGRRVDYIIDAATGQVLSGQ